MRPVLLHLGNFPLRAWGFLLMIAFLLGAVRAVKVAEGRYGISREKLWDASMVGLFGGVIGARLLYVLLNIGDYSKHPAQAFAIWEGGMTSFGGLLGGMLAGLWAAKKRGLNVLDVCDVAGPSLAIGMFFGRIGCLLNGCCYGHACTQPWAIEFHPENSPATGPVHPTQVYEAFGVALVYAFLTLYLEKRRSFPGQILLAFTILYGVVRFIVEFWRAQSSTESVIAGLSTGQWAGVLVIAVAAGFWPVLARKK